MHFQFLNLPSYNHHLQCFYPLSDTHTHTHICRDLKSLNLLVAEDYTIRVADFGLAVLKNSGTSQMVGTPSWMAPELFQGIHPLPSPLSPLSLSLSLILIKNCPSLHSI